MLGAWDHRPHVCVCEGRLDHSDRARVLIWATPRLDFSVRVFREALILSSPPHCLHSGLGIHSRQHATGKLRQAHPIKKEWKSRMEKKVVCENEDISENHTECRELQDVMRFRKTERVRESRADTHRVGSPGSLAAAAAWSRCRLWWCHPSRSCCSSGRRCTPCGNASAWRQSWCGPGWQSGWPLESTHTPGWGGAAAESAGWRRASSFLLQPHCDTLPFWAKGGLFKCVRVCANNWPVASCSGMTDVPWASKWGREYY